LVIKIHSDNAAQAKDGLKELIDNALELASAVIPGADLIVSTLNFKYHVEGDYILVGVTTTFPLINEAIKTFYDIVQSFVTDDFAASLLLEVGFKHDFSSLLNKSKSEGANIFQLLLEGFLFSLKIKYHAQLPAQLRDVFLNSLATLQMVPKRLRQLILLTLLQNSKLEINLKTLDEASSKLLLQSIGIPMSQLKFDDLLDQAKSMEPGAIISSIPPLSQALEFARTNLNANFSIGLKTSKDLLLLQFKTNGIKEVFDYVIGDAPGN